MLSSAMSKVLEKYGAEIDSLGGEIGAMIKEASSLVEAHAGSGDSEELNRLANTMQVQQQAMGYLGVIQMLQQSTTEMNRYLNGIETL